MKLKTFITGLFVANLIALFIVTELLESFFLSLLFGFGALASWAVGKLMKNDS